MQPTTETTSSPRRRGRRKQCGPLTRKKTGTLRLELTTPRIHTYDAPLCACAHQKQSSSPRTVGLRSNSPAGWLVRPYGGTVEEGQWMVGYSQRGPRAFCPADRRRTAWGGKRGGDVDGKKKEGLTGPALLSSLTRGLSSSREAARLSFLESQYPFTEPLST